MTRPCLAANEGGGKVSVSTADAPGAIGPYSQAIWAGDTLYLSGQIPINPETGALVESDIGAQTRQVFSNIAAVLREAGMTTDNVVKTTVYLVDMNDFALVNEVYAAHVGKPYPARSCVQVAALPKGARIEIEVTAVR